MCDNEDSETKPSARLNSLASDDFDIALLLHVFLNLH